MEACERAERECRECNGEWGPHGMLQLEGCVCRTRDGGTPCDDGADCEGQCIARGSEAELTCSEFTSLWGCYSYLPVGWSKQRPPRGKALAPPMVCAD